MLARSSSSDDFAAFLDAELDTSLPEEEVSSVASDPEVPEEEGYSNSSGSRVKSCKVEISKGVINQPRVKRHKVAISEGVISGSSSKKDVCPHPGFFKQMCSSCGQVTDEESGVAIKYIHENLSLSNDEIERLRHKDFKKSLRDEKLYLILDLDHTLLNSTHIDEITGEERYLTGPEEDFPDNLKSSLFKPDGMHMMTKLRPFVRTSLKEANKLFEMYIYTMGERSYAQEMAKLLDPTSNYFNSRVISRGDCTRTHQKGLDIVLGHKSAVLIMDDTKAVWGEHKDHLILMEKYLFFASSCKHVGYDGPSLSVLRRDESETDGALSTVLKVLQRIRRLFFDQSCKDNVEDPDVRQILRTVRGEILKGCKVVFSRVFPSNFRAKDHYFWKMAEEFGATCTLELDPSVTHIVAMDSRTNKSHWGMQKKKFLVHPSWIEASNYMWQKKPEENFPVPTKLEE